MGAPKLQKKRSHWQGQNLGDHHIKDCIPAFEAASTPVDADTIARNEELGETEDVVNKL